MSIQQIHHVAYRCNDAKETVEFYQNCLDMKFLAAVSEDRVPSTKEPTPYMHVFLDAGAGNIIAFFETPTLPPMGRDPNTPAWIQHLAFLVKSEEELLQAKQRLEAKGVDVVGPVDHGFVKSIYFFDPNGHRLELTTDTSTPEMMTRLGELAPKMLDEWSRTKQAVRHAAWVHEREFATVQ